MVSRLSSEEEELKKSLNRLRKITNTLTVPDDIPLLIRKIMDKIPYIIDQYNILTGAYGAGTFSELWKYEVSKDIVDDAKKDFPYYADLIVDIDDPQWEDMKGNWHNGFWSDEVLEWVKKWFGE